MANKKTILSEEIELSEIVLKKQIRPLKSLSRRILFV